MIYADYFSVYSLGLYGILLSGFIMSGVTNSSFRQLLLDLGQFSLSYIYLSSIMTFSNIQVFPGNGALCLLRPCFFSSALKLGNGQRESTFVATNFEMKKIPVPVLEFNSRARLDWASGPRNYPRSRWNRGS